MKFSNINLIVYIIFLVIFFTDHASGDSFCKVDDGEVAPLLRSTSNHLKDYRIASFYHEH